MGLSGQEHWSGLRFPSPGDLPDSGLEPVSLVLQVDSLPSKLYISELLSKKPHHSFKRGKTAEWNS